MRHITGMIVILLTSSLTACGGKQGPSGPGTALGEAGDEDALREALTDAETAATGMAVVRHVLYGEDAPDTAALAALPGRRAFVCAYQEKPRMICDTGIGDDLAGSLEAAAAALKDEAGRRIDPADKASIRLKFEVVRRSKAKKFDGDEDKPKARRVGTYGYFVTGADGEVSWLLPSELLERGIYASKDKCFKRKEVANLSEDATTTAFLSCTAQGPV